MEEKNIVRALFWISMALVSLTFGLMGIGVYLVVKMVGLPMGSSSSTASSAEVAMASNAPSPPSSETAPKPDENLWKSPDLSQAIQNKELIEYGKELIAHTAKYFGPKGTVNAATNGMNCQNCHLEAGTKPFGNNYGLVASTYPKYRARSGTIEDITKRVNDCFERSLNGKPLPPQSREMKAIQAYIQFVGSNVPKKHNLKGLSMKDNSLTFLERAASPEKGKVIYEQKCQSCHQANGQGVLKDDKTEYVYPPLWGPHSYNDAAGLHRISNFAKFVKYNMPLGASHQNIMLSDEEAWDVAAFVNSQPRPHKATPQDWPKLHEKPFDHPFGPYADPYSPTQHKYGPFQPIVEHQKKFKKH